MQQRLMAAAGRTGVDGETLARNMQNQMMGGARAGPLGMMGALSGMGGGLGGMMGRLGAGRGGGAGPMGGGAGPMGAGFGGMMGLPPGMGGRPGGPMAVPGSFPRGMDPGMRQQSMRCAPVDPGSRNMMGGGGMGGIQRPPDVMHPPMGGSPSLPAGTVSSAPSSTTSATELLSGRPGGMVGNLATTPGAVILGQPQPKKSDDQPAAAEMQPPLPPPGSGPPPPPAKKPEPLPPPRMLDDDEERALLQGQTTLPPLSTASSSVPPVERPSDPEPTRTETRSRGQDDIEEQPETAAAAAGGGEACTACQAGGMEFRAAKKCPHAFCVSCVQSYFSHGETECPVCGIKDELSSRTLTQPPSGHMLATYENGFKLPGFETTSRGTIIVTYSFPAGIQTVSIDVSLSLFSIINGYYHARRHCFQTLNACVRDNILKVYKPLQKRI